MLWTLLTGITSAMCFSQAVVAAKVAKAGLGGYALAIIIGSAIAIGNAYGLDKILVILPDHSSYSEKRQEWLGGAICLLVLLWGIVGAILTFWVTTAVMRLVA